MLTESGEAALVAPLTATHSVSVQKAQNNLTRSIRAAQRQMALYVMGHQNVELVAAQSSRERRVQGLVRQQSLEKKHSRRKTLHADATNKRNCKKFAKRVCEMANTD